MFKQKIDKELESKKKSEEADVMGHNAVKQVKLLTQGDAIEDMRILTALGSDHQLVAAQNEFGKKIELEKMDEDYDGAVYTIDQIRSLALKYNLRFLSSKRYTGHMDVQVVAKIKAFAETAKVEMDNYEVGRKFFILAPEQLFQLDDKVILRTRDIDPIMFYKIDDIHYKLIHKWGVDFSVLRLVSGFKWMGWWNHFLVNMLVMLPFAAAFWGLVLSSSFLEYHTAWSSVSILLTGIVYGWMTGIPMLDELDVEEEYFSPSKWNSDHKIRRR